MFERRGERREREALAALQRQVAGALLAADGEGMAEAAKLFRGGGRLASGARALGSRERLEIYRRSYWARLEGCLEADFPRLRAWLGGRAFRRMARAYLAENPSRRFTLRDLGERLAPWLRANPEYAAREWPLAVEIARLEWAEVVAFDGPMWPALTAESLAAALVGGGEELRLRVQPHIGLLATAYPVDRFRGGGRPPAAERCYLVVHRQELKGQELQVQEEQVYVARLEKEEFRLLRRLAKGSGLGEAVGQVPEGAAERLESWFRRWSALGWLTQDRGPGCEAD